MSLPSALAWIHKADEFHAVSRDMAEILRGWLTATRNWDVCRCSRVLDGKTCMPCRARLALSRFDRVETEAADGLTLLHEPEGGGA